MNYNSEHHYLGQVKPVDTFLWWFSSVIFERYEGNERCGEGVAKWSVDLFCGIQPKHSVSCHISVVSKVPCTATDITNLIGCPVLNAAQVYPGLSWKVKVSRHHLFDALSSSSETHTVRVWKNNLSKFRSSPSDPPYTTVCLLKPILSLCSHMEPQRFSR